MAEHNSVVERLERFEREIGRMRRSARRQRLAGWAVAGVLAALLVGGTGQPGGDGKIIDELRVRRLSVVDADGKVRIMAVTLPDGGAAVSWFDRDEKLRIAASTLPGGVAGVSWLDRDGKIRIAAATLPGGVASVSWHDRDEKPRIVAATEASGTVVLPTKDSGP